MHFSIICVFVFMPVFHTHAFENTIEEELGQTIKNDCIDNPNGIITDICGQSFENGNQEFDLIGRTIGSFKERVKLSKKQRKFINKGGGDNTVEDGQKRVVIKTDDSDIFDLWPAKEKIPYIIESSVGNDGKKAIKDAIQDIERFTCVRFKERDPKEKYFLKFFKGNGCWSFIGMRRDKAKVGQKISIGEGCESKGEVIHQIMHAFGFLNEHTREDRDIYVQINWENILPDKKKYFKINKQFVQNLLTDKYDYSSIMHYSRNKYSKNGKDTISIFGCSIKAKKILKIIGQRKGLSAGDKLQINKLFKCPTVSQRESIVDDTFKKNEVPNPETYSEEFNCNAY